MLNLVSDVCLELLAHDLHERRLGRALQHLVWDVDAGVLQVGLAPPRLVRVDEDVSAHHGADALREAAAVSEGASEHLTPTAGLAETPPLTTFGSKNFRLMSPRFVLSV